MRMGFSRWVRRQIPAGREAEVRSATVQANHEK
jgi:hypothetical protein